MIRRFILWGTFLGMIAVAIGAFGSHGLRAHFEANPDLRPTFETASQYHLIHAVALIGAAWGAQTWPNRWTRLSGIFFLLGVLLFSGSLYVLSILNIRFMGAVAPIGGTALILGWATLFWGVLRHPQTPQG